MRAPLGETFYNVDMEPAELWLKVGKILKQYRVDRNLKPIEIQRKHGPSYKTVQAIEAGKAGTLESLDKYAKALDLSIVDILQSILDSSKGQLTPEAAHVVRKFYETTVAGRQAFLSLSNAVPVETAGPAAVPAQAEPGRSPVTHRPPHSALRGAGRRKSS